MLDEERKKKLLTENSSVMNIIRLDLIRKLFQKYLSNQANAKEQEIVESWDAEAYWNRYLKRTPDSELEKGCKEVWEQVTDQICTENPSVDYGQYPDTKPTTRTVRISFPHAIQKYAAVAAIFLLLVAGTTLYFMTRQTNSNMFTAQQALTKTYFQTGTSNLKTVKLPDGSCIQMNRGTRFSYATYAFNRKQREVWLEGEAFFEVAKNKDKPFIIHTGNMTTTVRGTSFNVKAYPQLAENVVTVRTGKVEVSNQNKMLAVLTKNKQMAYNRLTNKTKASDAAWEDAAGWREGKLVLCNADVKELQFRIKQYFNADLTIEGSLLEGVMFNSSFNKGTGLEDILERICTLYNVHYEIAGNKIRIHA